MVDVAGIREYGEVHGVIQIENPICHTRPYSTSNLTVKSAYMSYIYLYNRRVLQRYI